MATDDEEPEKQYKLEVTVVEPLSFSSPYYSSHTTFNIMIKTNHPSFTLPNSEVRRRFSEFKWLRSILHRHHPEREPPLLPSRGFLVWNRFTPEFLESRRADLETFINEVIAIPVYLGEKALHLFIQTELSTKEIELNILGKRDDVIVSPIGGGTTLPNNIESNKLSDICYAEDVLSSILDDDYGSSGNKCATYLVSAAVENKNIDGSPWYLTSPIEVLGESSLAVVNDVNA